MLILAEGKGKNLPLLNSYCFSHPCHSLTKLSEVIDIPLFYSPAKSRSLTHVQDVTTFYGHVPFSGQCLGTYLGPRYASLSTGIKLFHCSLNNIILHRRFLLFWRLLFYGVPMVMFFNFPFSKYSRTLATTREFALKSRYF